MLQCPSCDTTLDQDFGLVTCKNCGAVLMVDPTGKVQVGPDEYHPPQEDFETSSTISSPSSVEEDIVEEFDPSSEGNEFFSEGPVIEDNFVASEESFEDDDLTPEPDQNFQDSEITELPEEEPIENETAFQESEADIESSSDSDFFESDEPEEAEMSSETGGDNSHSERSEESHTDPSAEPQDDLPEEDFTMSAEPDNEPVDITEFANSEASSLEGGELLYDVIIDGLDSSDMREDFKLVLMDPKLQLNHHTYLKNIKNGKVVVPDLNPIKAKRIVEQLQFFNLNIRWQQKRVIMGADHEQDESVDEDAEL